MAGEVVTEPPTVSAISHRRTDLSGLHDIRVHVDGGCEAGRVLPVRLVRADPANWIGGNDQDQAYAGTGWGSALLVGLFMGVFLLLVGGIPIVCVVLFPLMLLQGLWTGRGRTP